MSAVTAQKAPIPNGQSNGPRAAVSVGDSNPFLGAIDDLKIHRTALTPEQILAAEND